MKAKFVHTNLIAREWRKLAEFYITVFGCTYKMPERDLSGDWVDDLTHLKNARIKGIHLKLPGFDINGPTLEIFQYDENETNKNKTINKEGFGHIAFSVDEVDQCLKEIIKNGGSVVGKTVKGFVKGMGYLHVVYARDPEGNIIEIQKWE